jgi:hypothetical protein
MYRQNMKYLDLWFAKSLPWLDIEIHGSKIFFLSQYCVQNVSWESRVRPKIYDVQLLLKVSRGSKLKGFMVLLM